MSSMPLSTQGEMSVLLSGLMAAQQSFDVASAQVSTGQIAGTPADPYSNTYRVVADQTSIGTMQSNVNAAGTAQTNQALMATALTSVSGEISNVLSSATQFAQNSGSAQAQSGLQSAAWQALQNITSTLNATSNGQDQLFSGGRTSTPSFTLPATLSEFQTSWNSTTPFPASGVDPLYNGDPLPVNVGFSDGSTTPATLSGGSGGIDAVIRSLAQIAQGDATAASLGQATTSLSVAQSALSSEQTGLSQQQAALAGRVSLWNAQMGTVQSDYDSLTQANPAKSAVDMMAAEQQYDAIIDVIKTNNDMTSTLLNAIQ